MFGKFQNFFASLVADQRRRKRTLWLAVGLVVAGVFAFDSMPNQQVVASTPVPSLHFTSQTPPSRVSGGEIWVAIAGAVKHQGVYRLHPGDRVFSLVFMAGGFLRGAAQESVNLARTLVDGEQVIVAKIQHSVGGDGEGGAIDTPSAAATTTLPINRASASELEALPGIGPTLAQRIAQYRDKHGPFKSKADLLNVPGIGPKLVAGFADSIAY